MLQSKVFIMFMITRDGTVMDVKVARGGENCTACKKAALDLFKKMPKWIPAENSDGIPVSRRLMIPIVFG